MNTRHRTPPFSFCAVQLRTLCAAHSSASLCLSTIFDLDPGELPGFWGSMVFHHAPIPRKGSGKQQQTVKFTRLREIALDSSINEVKIKKGKTKTGKEKTGDRFQRGCNAALLRSFRRQHGKTMVCVKGVPWVTETLWKANIHFDPNQMGSETAPPR